LNLGGNKKSVFQITSVTRRRGKRKLGGLKNEQKVSQTGLFRSKDKVGRVHNELASVKAKMGGYFKYSKHDFYVRNNQLERRSGGMLHSECQ
jgi:hypothetical protein